MNSHGGKNRIFSGNKSCPAVAGLGIPFVFHYLWLFFKKEAL